MVGIRRFFWQVFVALALLSSGTLGLFYGMLEAFKDPVWASLASLTFAMAAGLILAYRLGKPLAALRDFVRGLARGEFSDNVGELRTEVSEIIELADDVQRVRDELVRKIHLISRQKNELDSLLFSMSEGVLAVDEDAKIFHMNRALQEILGIDQEGRGALVHEYIRIPEVLDVIHESLEQEQPIERDIELNVGRRRFVQVHSSPLTMDDKTFGVVLVFSDITRVRELEGMRKNFVANVSHELRTPLTSIQGFAETLMNPEVKDPVEIKKFVEIIQRHASRLGRIIEDILTLSRIERDHETNQIELKVEDLKPVLQAAVELCEVKAQKKKITLSLKCPDNLRAAIDRYLLEQAVVNLIDNAIRYSDDGRSVEVIAEQVNGEAVISIKDHGIGIADKQLPRIFERFYRIDRARSRELGGTGLGLSIVKHISAAHHGRVEVKSRLGEGSTFSIHLPEVTGKP